MGLAWGALTILRGVIPPEITLLVKVPLANQELELLKPDRGRLRIAPYGKQVILHHVGPERVQLPQLGELRIPRGCTAGKLL
jgi:hypothetical protein